MKNVILTQKFNFAEIEALKDYSRLIDKPEITNNLNYCGSTINDIFINLVGDDDDPPKNYRREVKILPKNFTKRKNTRYFYSPTEDELSVSLSSMTRLSHYTTNDKQIKRHYGRPFSAISLKTLERSVSIEGDKLYIRINSYLKHREFNCKYFRRHSVSYGVVFDFKKGNILSYHSPGKNHKGKFRQSNFKHLVETINSLFNLTSMANITMYRNVERQSYKEMKTKVREAFSDEEFVRTIYHAISSKTNQISSYIHNPLTYQEDLHNIFMELFISINKIKIPNEYRELMTEWYPTKKYLKKNENKLIAASLDRIGLKTKGSIKLIHKYPTLNLNKLLALVTFFGVSDLHKYIKNLNEGYFNSQWNFDTFYNFNIKNHWQLNTNEKSNVIKLLNCTLSEFNDKSNLFGKNIMGTLMELYDHFAMISDIKTYFPDTELKATNGKDFHDEHIELAKLQRTIKKGYSIRYNFDDRLIKIIEEPILIDDAIFFPYILKLDNEYTEEGTHMHHCVASYADRENSIIISLREDNVFGNERVTSEFAPNKECVQSKYFCNARPPERFVTPLEILSKRVSSYKGSIKSKSKEKIPLVINGVQIIVPEPKPTFLEMIDNHLLFDNRLEF